MTNLKNLTDGDLDQVSGGMDCKTAKGAARVYLSLAKFFLGAGDLGLGSFYTGKASGLVEGSCPK